jgi:bacteriocin biosynthesis cyclodehydratase domain-containing protein
MPTPTISAKLYIMERPAVKTFWEIRRAPSGPFVLVSERGRRFLSGKALEAVVPLLDGRRSVTEIIGQLAGSVPEDAVRAALGEMEGDGLLRDGPAGPRASAAFWELLGADPARLARAEAEVISIGDEGLDAVCEALAVLGVGIRRGAPFRIVIAPDYLDSRLAALNDDALRNGNAWMLAKPSGLRQWLGPLFIPGQTACWQCLAVRLHSNGWTAAASVAALPTTSAVTRTVIATEAAKWLLAGRSDALAGKIKVFDTGSLEIEAHEVAARPQCPACGRPAWRTLQRAAVGFSPRSGEHDRADRTLERLRRHASPLTGIVTRPERICEEPGFSVYVARTTQALRPDHSGRLLYASPDAVAGRGTTCAEAEAACLAEAVERHSAYFHGDEPSVAATYDELGEEALHPAELLHFSDSQYRARRKWNARHGGFQRVPEPFSASRAVDWVECRSLITGKRRYVPAAFCFFGRGEAFCGADSNGCAAGNTLEEAFLHGFLELVERDAVSLWWYNRTRRPAIDVHSFGSPRVEQRIKSLERLEHRVHVLDLTTDLEIHVFAAIAATREGRRVLLGTSAALDPERALWRALAELSVSALMAHEPIETIDDREYERWLRRGSFAAQPCLLPARGKTRPADEFPRCSDLSTAAALRLCLGKARRIGLDVLALDMTRPEIGFPVARVIAPGLRHWWRRLAPGRLYDTPVKLGWRKRAMTEREANPTPYFL